MRNPIILQPGPPIPIPMPSLPDINPFDHDLFSQSLLHPNNQETIGALTKAWNHVFVDRMLGKDAADETDAQGDVGACVGVCSTNESEEEQKRRKEEEAKRIHGNIEGYRGQDYNDVEAELDQKLRDDAGWAKEPLRDGNGWKYTSGNRQIQLNNGYPGGSVKGPSDIIHSGPYLKNTSTGIRVPLRR